MANVIASRGDDTVKPGRAGTPQEALFASVLGGTGSDLRCLFEATETTLDLIRPLVSPVAVEKALTLFAELEKKRIESLAAPVDPHLPPVIRDVAYIAAHVNELVARMRILEMTLTAEVDPSIKGKKVS